jgi:Flp pilus assembly protein TadB
MISLAQLWLPILLAAVLVFAASSLIHMVFKWHAADFHGFANEDEVRAALRSASAGQYLVPYCSEWKDMQTPSMQQKYKDGPIAFLLLRPPGAPGMGQPLVLWFLLNLAVAVLAGYLASRTLPPGASFLAVCRVVSIVTFLAYACGGLQLAIWMGKPWRSAAKEMLDAFIYGMVSAVAFAWLWPR